MNLFLFLKKIIETRQLYASTKENKLSTGVPFQCSFLKPHFKQTVFQKREEDVSFPFVVIHEYIPQPVKHLKCKLRFLKPYKAYLFLNSYRSFFWRYEDCENRHQRKGISQFSKLNSDKTREQRDEIVSNFTMAMLKFPSYLNMAILETASRPHTLAYCYQRMKNTSCKNSQIIIVVL